MGRYLKNHIPDLALCACMTLALARAICSGFAPEELHGGLVAAVAVITAVLVWLLTRSRPGTAALFLAGSILCAGAHFLQFPIPLWCLLLFVPAAGACFLLRVYAVAVERADLVGVKRGAYWGQTALAVLLAGALAGGIFFAVVRPLHPPTQELKLLTLLKSMEPLETLGVASTRVVLDPELASQQEPEEQETGDQADQEQTSDSPQGETDLPDQSQTESVRESVTSTLQQAWSAVRYDGHNFQWLWLLLLLPLAVALAYLWRYHSRQRWRRQVQALPRDAAVVNYYRFFLKRLGRFGLKRSPNATLREYAAHNALQLQPFEGADCSFADLTGVYEGVLYGRRPVTDREYAAYEAFFDRFYPALRRELGPVRYWLRAFRF
jgi:NADH:ubiquinone oxidoreductase subunit 6 (subunit J)